MDKSKLNGKIFIGKYGLESSLLNVLSVRVYSQEMSFCIVDIILKSLNFSMEVTKGLIHVVELNVFGFQLTLNRKGVVQHNTQSNNNTKMIKTIKLF